MNFKFILLACWIVGCKGNPKQLDWDTYTEEELKKIPELRSRVANDLKLRCMFENRYLVRFLRARKQNIDEAEKMMREFFSWRKKHDSDNMIYKDFTSISRRLPFYFIKARDGRPAAAGGLRDFNVRKLVITTGGVEQVRRYLLYAIERCTWNLHLVSNATGRELIEGDLLFNMAGFTLRNQGCIACIPLWIELATSYESFYPQLAHRIIVINMPRIFQRFYNILRPFISGHTIESLRIYGLDKTEWKTELLKIYPSDQLEAEFGGTARNLKLYTLTKEQIESALGPTYTDAINKQKH